MNPNFIYADTITVGKRYDERETRDAINNPRVGDEWRLTKGETTLTGEYKTHPMKGIHIDDLGVDVATMGVGRWKEKGWDAVLIHRTPAPLPDEDGTYLDSKGRRVFTRENGEWMYGALPLTEVTIRTTYAPLTRIYTEDEHKQVLRGKKERLIERINSDASLGYVSRCQVGMYVAQELG